MLQDDRPGFTFELEFVAKAVVIPEAFEVSEEASAVEWKTKEGILALDKKGKLRNRGQGATTHMLAGEVVLLI